MSDAAFPIEPLLPEIRRQLAAHPRLVLEAPPGAGKTTRVPPALLDADWLGGRRILMLEPRRVAARAAAEFMAEARGEAVGDTVGYRIRFESKVGPATRIEVLTEGILTRLIQDDPTLEGVGAILFDEFHERHLAGDLGLALALDVQAELRPDLRLVLMSATLDGEALARWFESPRLASEGRAFAVEVSHFPARRDEAIEAQTVRAVAEALASGAGDVLVFLPGRREIDRVARGLAARAGVDAEVAMLHGELDVAEQRRLLRPHADGRRRVVLATNLAESSVTLPGVRTVVDSGLAREPRFDPSSGFSRLAVVPISQASAEQRAGRAGRVAPGRCLRLWPASQRLEPGRRPEIAQVDLAGLALELAAWGGGELRFPDAPPPGALAAGRDLLRRLGALAGEAITPLGRRMLAFGTHPRLAAMLLAAPPGERALAADLAALVDARDPLPGEGDALALRWRALAALRAGRAPARGRGALAAIERAAATWRRRLGERSPPPATLEAHALGDLLAHAFPDRIARQHASDPRRYALANGQLAQLRDDSALLGEPWLVITELRQQRGAAMVLSAVPVDPARLRRDFPQRFETRDVVVYDPASHALRAERQQRFDAIVLDARPAGRPDPALFGPALVDAVRRHGLALLPFTEAHAQWRARVACLRDWCPELGLPAVDDEALLATLGDWLEPALAGKTRLDALTEAELGEALMAGIDWKLRQRVDQLAPRRIGVPSGRSHAIRYAEGEAPVLAVKLQELFGLAETPRIAEGRVPLVLHLLSPAGRPLQVTADLASFWNTTWPEVRREMKGRYPKHPWPEDPWNATPTHRARPRAAG